MGTIKVFHGTGSQAVPDFGAKQDLYGLYFVHDPYSSGTLVSSKDPAWSIYASNSVIRHRGDPIVLSFRVPEDMLIPTGPHTRDIYHYYTEDWVDVSILPDVYLLAVGFTVEEAVRRVNEGINKFYRVSHEYFNGFLLPD